MLIVIKIMGTTTRNIDIDPDATVLELHLFTFQMPILIDDN
jgi:hypothetical protein